MANLLWEDGASKRWEIKRKRERDRERRERERKGERERKTWTLHAINHASPGMARNLSKPPAKTTRQKQTCMKHYSTTKPTCRRSQRGMSHQRYCRWGHRFGRGCRHHWSAPAASRGISLNHPLDYLDQHLQS